MKKFLLIVVLLGAGFGAYWWWNASEQNAGNNSSSADQSSYIGESKTVTIEQKIESSGTVEPEEETMVKSEIDGRIERIFVKEGDGVEKDTKLIKLDTRSIEAELDEAQRRYEKQKLELKKIKRDVKRLSALAEDKFARESDYLDAQTDLRIAQLELEIREARLESVLDDKDKALIKAPLQGTVLSLNVNEGEVITGASSVSNGTELLKIANLDKLEIELDLNEIDVNKVSVGQKASIHFDAVEDKTFEGTIRKISPNAKQENNTHTFPVTVSINSVDPTIKPGISAKVVFLIDRAEEVLGVPLSAVFIAEGKDKQKPDRFLFTIENEPGQPKRYRKYMVKVGLSDDQYIEITDGFDEAGKRVSLIRPEFPEQVIETIDKRQK